MTRFPILSEQKWWIIILTRYQFCNEVSYLIWYRPSDDDDENGRSILWFKRITCYYIHVYIHERKIEEVATFGTCQLLPIGRWYRSSGRVKPWYLPQNSHWWPEHVACFRALCSTRPDARRLTICGQRRLFWGPMWICVNVCEYLVIWCDKTTVYELIDCTTCNQYSMVCCFFITKFILTMLRQLLCTKQWTSAVSSSSSVTLYKTVGQCCLQ
jgi:hypothetical protein